MRLPVFVCASLSERDIQGKKGEREALGVEDGGVVSEASGGQRSNNRGGGGAERRVGLGIGAGLRMQGEADM